MSPYTGASPPHVYHQIVLDFQLAMQSIAAPGYFHSVHLVELLEDNPIDLGTDRLPAILIYKPTIVPAQRWDSKQDFEMSLSLDAVMRAPDDSVKNEHVSRFVSDVQAAAYVDPMRGGLASGTFLEEDPIEPFAWSGDEIHLCGASMTFRIPFRTERNDPSAAA